MLPWIALIDKFQHWIYTNPNHTNEERENKWEELHKELSSDVIDYNPYGDFRKSMWHKQLHIFEVPFYYIEYGIAQLGAIGMWKQYKENPKAAIDNYTLALSKGGTQTLPELYKTAGLSFDFSPVKIKELMDLVRDELQKLS
jgi:oligoendopeptidase F